MKKTKILYLITGLNSGGAEILLWNLLKKINRDSFDPIVVSILPIGSIGEKIKKEGVRVLSLESTFKFNPLIIKRLISIIKKEKPEILHTHLFHANLLGKIIGLFNSSLIIISTIHNIRFKNLLREKLSFFTRRGSNIVIVISKAIAKAMLKKGVIKKKKHKIILDGIDYKKFNEKENNDISKEIKKEIGIEVNTPILLSVGRLHKVKGHSYLIRSIEIIKKHYPNLVLVVVGEGSERKKLEKIIRELNLGNKIFLIGEKNNIEKYLQIADLFILPSCEEGLGVSLMEAQAAGLLVLASNVGGIPEVIEDGENGFLVNPKDSKVLAEKIIDILSLSVKEKEIIRKNAQKNIIKNFSIEVMVKKYENLYRWALKRL